MTDTEYARLKRFLLLYASQTGQAEAIAEEIANIAPSFGLKADLHCISLTDKRFCIEKETCAVFIVATTGDGEPPDSAVKFFRRISRNTLKKDFLKNLNYTLLALGDSNYIKFCLFGRQLELKLKSLSATSFYPTGFGDDAFGIETGVDPWIQNLWAALQKQLSVLPPTDVPLPESDSQNPRLPHLSHPVMEALGEGGGQNLSIGDLPAVVKDSDPSKWRFPKLPPASLIVKYHENNDAPSDFVPREDVLPSSSSPFCRVQLVESRRLTQGEDVKLALELTFQFKGSSISYQPGDSFGFICSNPVHEVDLLLERCGVLHLAEKPVSLEIAEPGKRKLTAHVQPMLSLRDVFVHCVEIRSVPKKILLRLFAVHAENKEEKHALLLLASQEGSTLYTNLVRRPLLCTLDVLMQFKSCRPPIGILLEYLPFLKPRFYSVSSSPHEMHGAFKIVFNVLEFPKEGGRFENRKGVCTGMLSQLSPCVQENEELASLADQIAGLNIKSEREIYVYKRTNSHFYLPEVLSTPLVMVGPGTGVAPFLGFLRHREVLMQKDDTPLGEAWLFYGCRYEKKDFLFRSELNRLKSEGILSHLCVSHSREPQLPSGVTTRYVHQSIKEHATEVVAAIQSGAVVYVCGDAKNMALDVRNAFLKSFQDICGLSASEAKSYIESLQTKHQYLNDIWA